MICTVASCAWLEADQGLPHPARKNAQVNPSPLQAPVWPCQYQSVHQYLTAKLLKAGVDQLKCHQVCLTDKIRKQDRILAASTFKTLHGLRRNVGGCQWAHPDRQLQQPVCDCLQPRKICWQLLHDHSIIMLMLPCRCSSIVHCSPLHGL